MSSVFPLVIRYQPQTVFGHNVLIAHGLKFVQNFQIGKVRFYGCRDRIPFGNEDELPTLEILVGMNE